MGEPHVCRRRVRARTVLDRAASTPASPVTSTSVRPNRVPQRSLPRNLTDGTQPWFAELVIARHQASLTVGSSAAYRSPSAGSSGCGGRGSFAPSPGPRAPSAGSTGWALCPSSDAISFPGCSCFSTTIVTTVLLLLPRCTSADRQRTDQRAARVASSSVDWRAFSAAHLGTTEELLICSFKLLLEASCAPRDSRRTMCRGVHVGW